MSRPPHHLDAQDPQPLDSLDERRAMHLELPRQRGAGVRLTIRQQCEQRTGLYAARERNSHSLLTRCSVPARMRTMLPRWVKITKDSTARQKINSGVFLGSHT